MDPDSDSSRRTRLSSRPARFQPKLKGKHKAERSAEQEPTPPPAEPSQDPATALSLTDGTEESARSLREVDERADRLLREIDVFCSPSPLDEGAQVRVKPKQSEVEVVLSIDVDSENYDKDVAEPLRLAKQVVNELCISSKGSWVLRSADNPE